MLWYYLAWYRLVILPFHCTAGFSSLRHKIEYLSFVLITVRNEVAKVMFLHLSVCPQGGSASVHAGIPPPQYQTSTLGAGTPLGPDTPQSRHPPWEQAPPSRQLRCGRYASYWNAFLYSMVFDFQKIRSIVYCELN